MNQEDRQVFEEAIKKIEAIYQSALKDNKKIKA